jgi:hypothetical protein
MTTAYQVVNRALRLLQVIDPAQAPSDLDYETGQTALNAMLTRWEASGTAMGWQNVANPSDVLPTPPEAEEAIVYQLALRLAPEYGINPMPAVVEGASRFLADLLRDRVVEMPLRQTPDVPLPGAFMWRGNWGGW